MNFNNFLILLKDMKLGRNLARTFLDYYKLQNLIIFNPSTSITPKVNNSQLVSIKNQSTSLLGTTTNTNGNNNILNSSSGNSISTLSFLNTNNNGSATNDDITKSNSSR